MPDETSPRQEVADIAQRSRWTRARDWFAQRAFLRSVVVLTGSAALGQLIVVAASPIVTRLYSPEAFGIAAVYGSVLSLLLVVASLKYDLAIPIPESDETAAEVLVLSLVLVGATAALVGLVLLGGGGPLLAWLGLAELAPYAWLLPVGVLAGGAYSAFRAWSIRLRAFSTIARTQVTQSVGQVVTQFALGGLQMGAGGLLVATIVGQGSGVIRLLRQAYREVGSRLFRASIPDLRRVALRFRRFPMYTVPSAALNAAGLQLTPLFLARHHGADSVGLYALALRVMGLPMLLIARSLSQVYLGRAAALASTNPTALKPLFVTTTNRLFLGSLAIGAAVPVLPSIVSVVFGERWHEAGRYMQLLAPLIMAQFVTSPLSQTVVVIQRQDMQFWWDLARVVVLVAVFEISGRRGLSTYATIAVFSFSMTVMYVVLYLMYRHALNVFHVQTRTVR